MNCHRSQPQTDDTEILPQTQAATPSELVQSESTVKVEEADELLMKTGATETGLQPSQSSDRLVSLSGAPESNELQMEPDSTRTEPHDVSHSDRLLSLSLAADAYLVHGAEYIDDVFKSLGIEAASQSGACGSGVLDAGLSGITAASHSWGMWQWCFGRWVVRDYSCQSFRRMWQWCFGRWSLCGARGETRGGARRERRGGLT